MGFSSFCPFHSASGSFVSVKTQKNQTVCRLVTPEYLSASIFLYNPQIRHPLHPLLQKSPPQTSFLVYQSSSQVFWETQTKKLAASFCHLLFPLQPCSFRAFIGVAIMKSFYQLGVEKAVVAGSISEARDRLQIDTTADL